MKHCKKAIALLLSVLMILSLCSVVGFAGDDDTDPPADPPEEQTKYTVTFYDAAATDPINLREPAVLTIDNAVQRVNKGEDAVDPLKDENGKYPSDKELKNKLVYPAEVTDDHYMQHFIGWNQDITNVQEDLPVFPKFAEIGKRYNVHYYDHSGKFLFNAEGCTYGDNLQQPSTPTRTDDPLRYRYEFAGWALKPNIDPLVNKDEEKYLLTLPGNRLVLPTDRMLEQYNQNDPNYIDVCGKKVAFGEDIDINFYAYFKHYDREYKLSLTVRDQYGDTVPGAAVQIKGDDGQLMDQTFGQRDENGNLTGRNEPAAGKTDANGYLAMRLPYQNSYRIAVTYRGSDASGDASRTISVSEMQDPAHPETVNENLGVTVTLQKTLYEHGKERCTCICHSFLGGVWIRVLNILYDFLHVKYVCCDDMYATHRGQLAYS